MSLPSSTTLRRRTIAMALGAVMLLGGCSTPTDMPMPTPRPATPAVPAGGVLLSQAGFQHGPREFSLPVGLVVDHVVDQSNVVTFVCPLTQASLLGTYLRTNLPAMGWTITADAGGSLLATGQGWDAAYTTSAQAIGLTLRKQGTVND